MFDEKMSKKYLFDRLSKVPAEEVEEAYKDLAKKAAFSGEEHSQIFEIDGEEVNVPLRAMHDYREMQKEKATDSKAVVREGQLRNPPKFVNLRNALNSNNKLENEENKFIDNENDYYWDTNYNYEYMNPESEKRRVLGRIKK